MQQRKDPLPETQPLWDEGVSAYSRKCILCGSPQSRNLESYYIWILPPRQYLGQDILFYLIYFLICKMGPLFIKPLLFTKSKTKKVSPISFSIPLLLILHCSSAESNWLPWSAWGLDKKSGDGNFFTDLTWLSDTLLSFQHGFCTRLLW